MFVESVLLVCSVSFYYFIIHIIFIVNCCHCTEKPKPTVTIEPARHVFSGETVTLRCDIYDGVTSWQYYWHKEGLNRVFSDQQEHTFSSVTESDAGEYSCEGSDTERSHWSQMSDKVTLTVSGEFDHLFIFTQTHRTLCGAQISKHQTIIQLRLLHIVHSNCRVTV
uniref:Ig-like domain-containing protein n=1 Tax=Cyprinus carpio TaxID=7962 RepID=A0A8C1LRH6_CYPCA